MGFPAISSVQSIEITSTIILLDLIEVDCDEAAISPTSSMAPISNLAVVLCHGSYHTPAPYEPFIQALKAHGIDAYCPQRPSSDLNKLNVGDVNNPDFDREPPNGGYPSDSEDVQVIVQLLQRLVNDEGKSVLLAGHSSGGWVAAQAALPTLQANTRKSNGQSGGIIGIFFIGAFIIPVGESVHSFFQPKDGSLVTPPFMTFHVSWLPIVMEPTK